MLVMVKNRRTGRVVWVGALLGWKNQLLSCHKLSFSTVNRCTYFQDFQIKSQVKWLAGETKSEWMTHLTKINKLRLNVWSHPARFRGLHQLDCYSVSRLYLQHHNLLPVMALKKVWVNFRTHFSKQRMFPNEFIFAVVVNSRETNFWVTLFNPKSSLKICFTELQITPDLPKISLIDDYRLSRIVSRIVSIFSLVWTVEKRLKRGIKPRHQWTFPYF